MATLKAMETSSKIASCWALGVTAKRHGGLMNNGTSTKTAKLKIRANKTMFRFRCSWSSTVRTTLAVSSQESESLHLSFVCHEHLLTVANPAMQK